MAIYWHSHPYNNVSVSTNPPHEESGSTSKTIVSTLTYINDTSISHHHQHCSKHDQAESKHKPQTERSISSIDHSVQIRVCAFPLYSTATVLRILRAASFKNTHQHSRHTVTAAETVTKELRLLAFPETQGLRISFFSRSSRESLHPRMSLFRLLQGSDLYSDRLGLIASIPTVYGGPNF